MICVTRSLFPRWRSNGLRGTARASLRSKSRGRLGKSANAAGIIRHALTKTRNIRQYASGVVLFSGSLKPGTTARHLILNHNDRPESNAEISYIHSARCVAARPPDETASRTRYLAARQHHGHQARLLHHSRRESRRGFWAVRRLAFGMENWFAGPVLDCRAGDCFRSALAQQSYHHCDCGGTISYTGRSVREFVGPAIERAGSGFSLGLHWALSVAGF